MSIYLLKVTNSRGKVFELVVSASSEIKAIEGFVKLYCNSKNIRNISVEPVTAINENGGCLDTGM